MYRRSCVIDGERVTLKLTVGLNDTLQAFAVRADCFIDEQDLGFDEEFDGYDHHAIHLIASLGKAPIGTVRRRWFNSFIVPDHLAVGWRFRGQAMGALLLDRARAEAASRRSRMLYARATPLQARYLERLGWLRLEETPGGNSTLALIQPTGFVSTGASGAQHRGDTIVSPVIASRPRPSGETP